MESRPTESERHEIIQTAAYYLWQERGSPFGAPELDWFRAEEELRQSEYDSKTPAAIAVAAAVGSALGTVAGIVSSVGGLVRSEDASEPR